MLQQIRSDLGAMTNAAIRNRTDGASRRQFATGCSVGSRRAWPRPQTVSM
jgi:hypothetical protein